MNQWDDPYEASKSGWSAPIPVYVPATAADAQIVSTEVRLCGWSFRETAAAVATFNLVSGDSANGRVGAVINLAAAGNSNEWMGDYGVRFEGGIFLDRLTGTVEGVVWLRFPMPNG